MSDGVTFFDAVGPDRQSRFHVPGDKTGMDGPHEEPHWMYVGRFDNDDSCFHGNMSDDCTPGEEHGA